MFGAFSATTYLSYADVFPPGFGAVWRHFFQVKFTRFPSWIAHGFRVQPKRLNVSEVVNHPPLKNREIPVELWEHHEIRWSKPAWYIVVLGDFCLGKLFLWCKLWFFLFIGWKKYNHIPQMVVVHGDFHPMGSNPYKITWKKTQINEALLPPPKDVARKNNDVSHHNTQKVTGIIMDRHKLQLKALP